MSDRFQISLAAARVNAKMTQDEAATAVHVTKKTIINWEKGVTTPSADKLYLLSRVYNCPIDNIFLPLITT